MRRASNGRPEDQLGLVDWYETIAPRWGIEPVNRFRKERLYAELPKVQTAGRSDHWQLLLQVIEWMLYFARLAVTQKVLPWQKPQPPEKITPNRVIESLAGHLSEVGTPAKPPLPRGNAPGWPTRAAAHPARALQTGSEDAKKDDQSVKERMSESAEVEKRRASSEIGRLVTRQVLSFICLKSSAQRM